MFDVVEEANSRIGNQTKITGLTTGKVRSVSSALYKNIEDKSIDNILILCEQMLNERDWALGVIAYDWAYRVRKQYNNKTFLIFEKWLKKFVTGWGDCDDFCTHAVGELISQNNELFDKIVKWTEHSDFWVRRASAVSLIYPIRKDRYKKIDPFLISDILMNDEHHLVLKGYGWMLKVLSQAEPDSVFHYLLKKKEIMPRISFRYALEKFDEEKKICLMKN